MEKPVELADYVLAGQGDWNEKKIRQAMLTPHSASAGGRLDGHSVTLEQPLPVYIVYFTAFVRDGIVNFRRDAYGKDREAMARLGKLRPTDPRLCEDSRSLFADEVPWGRSCTFETSTCTRTPGHTPVHQSPNNNSIHRIDPLCSSR